MPDVRRLSIAAKLLVWSGSLIVVFLAVTAYLIGQVRSDAKEAERIVKVNHDLDSSIQRMLERLVSVQDNIRRYKLLGNEDAVKFIVEDLTRFGEILEKTLTRHPRYKTEWQVLSEDFEITLDPVPGTGANLAPDATVLEWTDILEQSQLDNQADLELALTRQYEAGERASRIGLYGLALCLAIGLGGGLALAWSLNRSLTEIRRGIRELGTGSTPKDVRVLSGDELGELALAFNAMAHRLRREEAMRADFVAMLSHEIRTPLTSIRESVDLIGSGVFGEVNERQREFLSIAEKETVRLSGLLSRLMTVSRMESQSLELAVEKVDCNELASSALERIAPAAEAKGIRLESRLPEPSPVCLCDKGHIQQVLLNLLGNGVKFSPEGGAVSVSVSREPKRTVFSVTDSGPGIPEEERERVFLKYYREPGVRESVDGAGLGLAIVKRIVDAHGGKITLTGGPNGGSVFRFTLPDPEDKP
ncbi:HAMP domain-containing protein [Pseudodesulfovibrio cashew]|uniref:histidine kinase n=1 Tax=Pseudodesulfovibrio cashew TaxID=2678688 RepID=A0A6I6JCM9_9BACT|nr:HAMP domain-containing sensor histidine kinase [Pseudodesulfovibrio cashew]QGY38899.1 HAMP domain-containing protein [Pseudodesulfovibrio cashew]